ncbi:MAG: hypothetical protein JF563_04050, partial [Acidobacteriales bacterium]|nr:hypothetical protein [Terriglobales bacterium]
GLKYFSGTAIYTKTFDVPPAAVTQHSQMWIDLGDVRNIAEVSLNGKALGTLWHAPYRVNIGSALHSG